MVEVSAGVHNTLGLKTAQYASSCQLSSFQILKHKTTEITFERRGGETERERQRRRDRGGETDEERQKECERGRHSKRQRE